jgi:site-specific recombinase XerD
MSSIRFACSERIGLHHLAFYRAWINGLDLADSGERYLGERDTRVLQSLLQSLRDRFVQAARRANLPRYARLLATRLRPADVRRSPASPVTLEDFAQDVDPDGLWSEAELLQMYQERFGAAQDGAARASEARRQRWIEQQTEALFWIERFLVSTPMPNDALDAWLQGTAIAHLRKHGIETLADLKRFIEHSGKRWYARIPGIGEPVAARIVAWLAEQADYLGALDARAHMGRLEVARQQPQPLPLQRLADSSLSSAPLLPPAERERVPGALIGASTDEGALRAWIEARAGSEHTARMYRREAERFLLFLAQEKGKGLHDVRVEDVNDYKNFLALLGRDGHWPFRHPASSYLAPRNTPRADARWRPFEGPLSTKSAQYALIVLRSWFDFLVRAGYLPASPFACASLKVAASDMRQPVKGLSRGQMDLVFEGVNALPESHEAARLRFCVSLAYYSAARLSELVCANAEDLVALSKEHEAGHYWMLGIHGKGGRIRNVYLPPAVEQAWAEYAPWRGLPTRLSLIKGQDIVLIAGLKGQPMTESGLYRLIKDIFALGADVAHRRGLYEDEQVIRACSPHDFRHSRARHLGQSSLALPILQRLLGHASLSTTGIYTSCADWEMAQALAQADAQ